MRRKEVNQVKMFMQVSTTLDVLSWKFPPRPRSMLEIPTQSMHTNFYPNIEKGGGGGIFSNIWDQDCSLAASDKHYGKALCIVS